MKSKLSMLVYVACIFVGLPIDKSIASISTVSSVDVAKYAGRWYRISANPLPFEKDCFCTQQTLAPISGSPEVSVYNSCNDKSASGPLREIRGTAKSVEPISNAKFEVDFGFPRKGEYWIIGLGQNYEYAVVTDSRGDSLYILSKTPTLDPKLYLEARDGAALQVDTSKLEVTDHSNCSYPL